MPTASSTSIAITLRLYLNHSPTQSQSQFHAIAITLPHNHNHTHTPNSNEPCNGEAHSNARLLNLVISLTSRPFFHPPPSPPAAISSPPPSPPSAFSLSPLSLFTPQAEHLERRRERHRLEEQKRRERIKFRKSTQRLQEFSEGKYGVGEAEEKAFKGFVCTACGEFGHKSTNRKCIYYEATMRENAKARDQASAQGLIQPKDASGLKLTVKTGEVEKRREKATVSLNLKNTLAHKRKQEAEAYTSNLTKVRTHTHPHHHPALPPPHSRLPSLLPSNIARVIQHTPTLAPPHSPLLSLLPSNLIGVKTNPRPPLLLRAHPPLSPILSLLPSNLTKGRSIHLPLPPLPSLLRTLHSLPPPDHPH